MKHKSRSVVGRVAVVAVLFGGLISATSAEAFNLTVVGQDGSPIGGFRWMVEEDTSHPVTPGVSVDDSLSLSIHNSYAPVLATGSGVGGAATISLPSDTRYFVSILSDGDFALGGGPVAIGQSDVTVVLTPLPKPTAQISVVAFHDVAPINGQFDTPQESGMAGFTVRISDAAGQVIQDAFGNALGTTYLTSPDGTPSLDIDGQPIIDPSAPAGTGILLTDAEGVAVVKNIPPGLYGVEVIPPLGEGWIQTTTIEGSKTIDAWVEANEPIYFQEFGPAGPHAVFGYVQEFSNLPPGGTESVSGEVVSVHNSRPPDYTFYPGAPVPNCWVGLNEVVGGGPAMGVAAQPCAPDSTFSISGIEPGVYELVIWDAALDYIIGSRTMRVPEDAGDLGQVMVFAWFGRMENLVFFDLDEDGFQDPSENFVLPEQNVNIRFRDGTIYKAFPTDLAGEVPFDEVFPFFRWLVAEVDFARYKATGATITVDGGGPVAPGEVLTPQEQIDPITGQDIINPNTGDNLSRTEVGPVLTQAFQAFLGTTVRFEWGKTNYGPGENGGISGMVLYGTTRAEDDPRFAAGEEWEPGIPRVQVNLYEDFDQDGVIDDVNDSGFFEAPDVDNFPFHSIDNPFPGPEDVDHNDNGSFDDGDAVRITSTDSWDDNRPTGCPPSPSEVFQGTQNPFWVNGDSNRIPDDDCFEGLRTYTQARDGLFDGGYAFGGPAGEAELPEGTYIVEAIAPPHYIDLKEEDKNVDFGEAYVPSTQVLPPICVGDRVEAGYSATVPAELVLFPGVPAPFAGEVRPLCNRKQITLGGGGLNAAVDFWMYTEVPKASRMVGFVLDDLANEFDPTSPQFGEKFGPAWIPISIRDYTGNEISRIYSDEFGQYNAMVPSTYTVNAPSPTGVSQNMLTVCLNDPGPIPDPSNPGATIIDPQFKKRYSQFCYTFNYGAGTTRYNDTPVIPIAAHTGPDKFPLDCEPEDGTPRLARIDQHGAAPGAGGPFLSTADVATGTARVVLTAVGDLSVLNPSFDPPNNSQQTIVRDYGFGTVEGTVSLGGNELPVGDVDWSDDEIVFTVPIGTTTTQILVRRGDTGIESPVGITLEIGDPSKVVRVDGDHEFIQDAIDAADSGDIILVAPGFYRETVILYKNVKLQGYGESTIINAVQNPAPVRPSWRDRLIALEDALLIDTLPGQAAPSEIDALLALERSFTAVEGPPIFVMTRDGEFLPPPNNARIDGFTLTGADGGGGVGVNGYARHLEISNNRIVNNAGSFGGGIRIGVGNLIPENQELPIGSENQGVSIHHNHVAENGGIAGPGGIVINAGADGYSVADNYVCGNFSQENGAGVAHVGLSPGGVIEHNEILFNESWNGTTTGSGGGIAILGGGPLVGLGEAGPAAAADQPLTPGTGDVRIEANLIQGNSAGTGNGGGIQIAGVNGADIEASPADSSSWYGVDVFNNIIVNNVAGNMGAISIQDAVKTRIVHNTIACNDSTGTAISAFNNGTINNSDQQPAGIVAHAHSDRLDARSGIVTDPLFGTFSDPELANNIIWKNRSFYWDVSLNGGVGGLAPDPSMPLYDDLAVVGTAGSLNPTNSVLTDVSGTDPSNTDADPGFVAEYVNGERGVFVISELKTIAVVPAFDEAGNFLDMSFGPLRPTGDYHLLPGSSAQNIAGATSLSVSKDFDRESRPEGPASDSGADEITAGVGAPDLDGDGIADVLDNCIMIPNADQRDPNGDGYGAICDPDLNGDLMANFGDLALFAEAFFGDYQEDADFNGDGAIDFGDLSVMAAGFYTPPGPSGVVD